jgi:DNA repair protein RecO (recombination protein O)
MQYILQNDIQKSIKANVSEYILNELEKILIRYLQVHIGNINLKSIELLKNISKANL